MFLIRKGSILTGGFQEQGQCFLFGLSCCILTIVFYSFFISLLSTYGLVLWGWGLRTYRVHFTLSAMHCRPFFNNNNNNNNINNNCWKELLFYFVIKCHGCLYSIQNQKLERLKTVIENIDNMKFTFIT